MTTLKPRPLQPVASAILDPADDNGPPTGVAAAPTPRRLLGRLWRPFAAVRTWWLIPCICACITCSRGDATGAAAGFAALGVATIGGLPFAPSASPPDAAAAAECRVMSFNIRYGNARDGINRWTNRRDLVVGTICAFDPDVLGVQECLSFQADELQAELPEYGFVGVGRLDGKHAGEMTPILYRTDRFEKLAEGHFWLSERPDTPGSRGWDAALPRVASWVRLRDRLAGGRTLTVFNTHLDYAGVVARLQSGRLLRRTAESLGGDEPVLVMGDFNAPADRRYRGPYRVLTDPASSDGDTPFLLDAFRCAHEREHGPHRNDGTYHRFRGVSEGWGCGDRIDWILLSPAAFDTVDAAIDRFSRDGRYPSDHFPVTAVLRWKRSGDHDDDRALVSGDPAGQ